jgi:hypothetical protein
MSVAQVKYSQCGECPCCTSHVSGCPTLSREAPLRLEGIVQAEHAAAELKAANDELAGFVSGAAKDGAEARGAMQEGLVAEQGRLAGLLADLNARLDSAINNMTGAQVCKPAGCCVPTAE